jgi:predicted metal-dependent peptidase
MDGQLDRLKLSAARLWAAGRYPYFATGLFAMVPVAEPGTGTFAIDRSWRVYIDPECVAEWSVPELGSVLIHELAHLLRDHAGRAEELGIGSFSALAWNIACDAEINDDLLEQCLPLPGNPVTPGFYGWPDAELAEAYFGRIRWSPIEGDPDGTAPPIPFNIECGSGSHAQERGWEQLDGTPGVGRSEADLLRRQTAVALTRHHRESGDVAAGWLRWAEDRLRPKIDWRQVLSAEIRRGLSRSAGSADYSFARRSRRASATPEVLLPGTFRPSPQVAVVLDTSGSMDDDLLARALAEVDGILTRVGLATRRVSVLSCDAAVGAITQVTRSSEVQLVGGGGTDMGEGLAAAVCLRPRPQVVIVLTDGYTPWPAGPPTGVSVVVGLVGLDSAGTAPEVPRWARAVRIEEAA